MMLCIWWENFDGSVSEFSYLFVSSEFRGHYKDNIKYIKERTGCDGSVISAKNLLLFAENVHSGKISYNESFDILRTNDETVITI